jgi:hypothetical protein
MNKLVLALILLVAIVSCKNQQSAKSLLPDGVHEVVAKETINTSVYTYVLVAESGQDKWLAIPKAEIKIGGTYYYQGGLPMQNFESKELNRNFDQVLFLEVLSDNLDNLNVAPVQQSSMPMVKEEQHTNVNTKNLKKIEVQLAPAKGSVSIAQLYANKGAYASKKIKIAGQVTKFSPEIMNKNWVHIQDGSEHNGKFDLTLTTNELVSVGDTLTFEGTVFLDKDFGYGYAYEILIEDAVVLK